jgi:uncharacterized small protein (DUF1192 family)
MERKTTTARMLYDTMTAYIDDHKHSRDVSERWLGSVLEPLLGTISGVMNRGSPNEANRKAVAAFRAAEIEKEIADKRKEIERLERDLKTTAL